MIDLNGNSLTIEQLAAVAQTGEPVAALDRAVQTRMAGRSRANSSHP